LSQPGGCAKGDACPYSHQLGATTANNGSTTQEKQPEPQTQAISPSVSRVSQKQNLPAEVLEKKKTTVLLQAAKQAAEDATKASKATEGVEKIAPKIINITTGEKRMADQGKREREEREAKEKAERERRRSEIEARERQRREQQQKEQEQQKNLQPRQQKKINEIKPPAASSQPPQPVKFGVKSLTDLIGDKKPASSTPITIPTKSVSVESPKTSVSSSPSSVKRDADLISSSPASSKKQKLNTSIGAFHETVSDFSTDDIDNELRQLGVDVTDLGNSDFKDIDDIDIEE